MNCRLIHLTTEDIQLSLQDHAYLCIIFLVFILLFKVYAQRHHLLWASILLNFKITVFFQTLIMYPLLQVFNRQYTKIFDLLLKNAFEFFLPIFLPDIPFTLHVEVTLYTKIQAKLDFKINYDLRIINFVTKNKQFSINYCVLHIYNWY